MAKTKHNLIRFQYHFTGPRGASDELIARVLKAYSEGEPLPAGWKVKEIYWGHKRGQAPDQPVKSPELEGLARLAAVKGRKQK